MMVRIDRSRTGAATAVFALLVGVATLTGCGERPYPTPAHEASAPQAQPVELAGAASAPLAPGDAAYAAQAPIPEPTPPLPPEPQAPARAASDGSAVVYDLGPVVGEPRPRPAGDGYVYPDRGYAPTPSYAAPAFAPAPRPQARRHIRIEAAPAAPLARFAPAKPHAAPLHRNPALRQDVAGKAAHASTASKTRSREEHKAALAQSSGAKPHAQPGATATRPATDAADRPTRLAALQTALRDAVSAKAVLSVPARMAPNEPVDVSLTLPADFADTVRKAAEQNGLADAAASVNLTALLAGGGYSATPDEMQSQPLTVGQPTEFHWTVTAGPAASGDLHAEMGAKLLGGGVETLNLGAVQKTGASGAMKLTPRILGAGLLALIVILVLGWLARGRSGPARSAARRASRRAPGVAGSSDRPLDMGAEPAPRDHSERT